MVYFIETGQIKLLLLSPEGKECLLAIHSGGDIFGELCLAGLGARHETAMAMQANEAKTNTLCPVLCALEPGRVVRGIRALPSGADCRPTAGHRQSGDGGQRAAVGPDVVAIGPHHGQEGPAQHPHRAEDFPRGTIRDGRHDAAADQLVHAAISQPWVDRNQ